MTDISLAMIVKDEPADRVAMLLEYMKPVVSQVVIADTGSKTSEIELYKTWSDHIVAYDHEWKDDFSEARNSTLEHIPDSNFVLHLDADELPSADMMNWLREIRLNEDKRPYGYKIWTINFWAGERGPTHPYHWHVRLFRRKVGKWYQPVHEIVSIKGKTELQALQSGWIKYAPQNAYLIHSKPQMHMERADTLYRELGDKPRP